MMNAEPRFNRFKDAPWFPINEVNVLVGGAGGIGSWLILILTRAGFTPVVYDFDIYEEHNMGGQLCKTSDVRKPKVNAIRDTVKDFCANKEILVFNEKYTESSMSDRFCFSGFDNMEARKAMFDNWKKGFGNDPSAIFIDGRLTMEQLQIFCVQGNDLENIKLYEEEYLFNDSEVEEVACTMKQTTHSAMMIASHMMGFFTNHFSKVNSGDQSRNIPFMWEYFIPIDYLNVI